MSIETLPTEPTEEDLNPLWPRDQDFRMEGAEHIRLIKRLLQHLFEGGSPADMGTILDNYLQFGTVIAAGDGLTGGGTIDGDNKTISIAHENSSDLPTINMGEDEIITKLELDEFGHVTGVEKAGINFPEFPELPVFPDTAAAPITLLGNPQAASNEDIALTLPWNKFDLILVVFHQSYVVSFDPQETDNVYPTALMWKGGFRTCSAIGDNRYVSCTLVAGPNSLNDHVRITDRGSSHNRVHRIYGLFPSE